METLKRLLVHGSWFIFITFSYNFFILLFFFLHEKLLKTNQEPGIRNHQLKFI